ncbi:Aspartate carbamoyltransferase, partial [hydrothermal vent metagenome]
MHPKTLNPLFDYKTMKIPTINSNGLTQTDILSVSQFNPDNLTTIFSRAREMREMVQRVGGTDLLKGKVLACLFYEPSTRTSASFIAAMERLGGSVIPITQGVQFSSVSKGETLADTI